jgi:TOMM system kinase/cyclase fusion protein
MLYVFGDYCLDLLRYELHQSEAPIPLSPKVFQVLAYLVTHRDRVVLKQELLDHLWPGQYVGDAALHSYIMAVRQAIGDDGQAQRLLRTVRGRGYRFVAPVEEHPEVAPETTGPAPPVALPLPTEGPPGASAALPPATPAGPLRHDVVPPIALSPPEAERRHLTVLFCDLVDSTRLAEHLDPEDLREVVCAYHQTCAAVIQRFDGYIAQYLGDGVLVYFGYPVAHEDDAQRAVRTGLGILHAIEPLNTRLPLPPGTRVAVRLGIHTGVVVVGDVGAGARQEPLALGVPPTIAARLQALAAPNTLVISAATWQLLGGFFICQSLGTPRLQGVTQPLAVYQVLAETTARGRLDAAGTTGLTPLVGREQEIGLLLERWAQVKDGFGQVVLLSGEAGIGKSRLVQVLEEHVATEPQAWLTPCQCSPYFQHTALYPWIDLLERVVLRCARDESPPQRLRKLEEHLGQYGLPLAEAVPLFAALLSLPLAAPYAPLTTSPEQQKQQILHALLTILLRIATQQPVLFVMEDLHWVDPTTLELLSLLVDQGPTARILALFTCRPDFVPPWTGRSHLTQLMLQRLPRSHAAELTDRVARGKALPPEVVEQIVARTDGVPLFVEELTKMVLESGLLQEREGRYELTGPLPPLAIPATLHDSLMARLDRLAAVKGLAQLGATLGREFSYALLRAVAPWDEATVQQGLHQLVAAEFLYQRGLLPQATYLFKHVLIQDAAYQSLLKSMRQQYHRQIAQVLEIQFPETAETQPELLAHHYTAAGLSQQAIPYWQRAGQRALERSANMEALSHLTKGLDLLTTLPDTAERAQHELGLQTTLGSALMAIKGQGAPEVGQAYARARELCRQMGETPQLFPVLFGLWRFYLVRAEYQTARELAEQCFRLAQRVQAPALRLAAHFALGVSVLWLGEIARARAHLEHSIALYDPQEHRALAFRAGLDLAVWGLSHLAQALWLLGYPDQALRQNHAALTLAQELSHPPSLAAVLFYIATIHGYRQEAHATQEQAEAAMALASDQGFPQWLTGGMILRGWALAMQGRGEEGVAQLRQALAAWRAMGAGLAVSHWLVLLAEAYRQAGQAEEGLRLLDEALAHVDHTGERHYAAEVHWLKGELLLRQAIPDEAQAEISLHQALAVAHHQQAKSWELRAAMSLARLWQSQGKRQEAYDLLAPVYNWFTEGFDTTDLQEAKALLDELEG